MKETYLKQIVLITDGRSNVGGDPAQVAAKALESGVIVNAIGICKPGSPGAMEVENIARFGGGEYQIIELSELAESVRMVTQKSTMNTIRSFVSMELKKRLGKELTDIVPEKRDEVVRFMEHIEEDIPIKCLILLDTSGSMAEKLVAAKDSAINLVKSFSARKAKGLVAIMTFPGTGGEVTRLLSDFTCDENQLRSIILKPTAQGATPTAYAIKEAAEYFNNEDFKGLEKEYVV